MGEFSFKDPSTLVNYKDENYNPENNKSTVIKEFEGIAGAKLLRVSQKGDIVTVTCDGELSDEQNNYVENLI